MDLRPPVDSIAFFEAMKVACEKKWKNVSLDPDIWGYQIQQDTQFKPGLTDVEIMEFEEKLGFSFPLSLRNFYKTMNGTTKPGINIGGGNPPEYESKFYSLPDDIDLIEEYINWIYENTHVQKDELKEKGISRIFPIYAHRFMLIDHPGNPILSMWGNDIIYWAESIDELLAKDIFGISRPFTNDDARNIADKNIKFWLDFN